MYRIDSFRLIRSVMFRKLGFTRFGAFWKICCDLDGTIIYADAYKFWFKEISNIIMDHKLELIYTQLKNE